MVNSSDNNKSATAPASRPAFPISILFRDDNEEIVCANEEELATSLEWFDSSDEKEGAVVTDSQGRRVRLKVKTLLVAELELEDPSGEAEPPPAPMQRRARRRALFPVLMILVITATLGALLYRHGCNL